MKSTRLRIAVAFFVSFGLELAHVTAAVRYATSAEARSAVESFRQQILQDQQREQQLRAQIQELEVQANAFRQRGPDVAAVDQQIATISSQLRLLNQQRNAALDEVQRGLFCSDCKRSKTQIEIEERPTTFEQHIVEGAASGRHVISSPELIAAAKEQTERTFDAKIAPLQAQLERLRQERNQIVWAFNNSLARMRQRIDQVHVELAKVELDEQNARFQLNYASAMASSLEQTERWKAEQDKRRALEKA